MDDHQSWPLNSNMAPQFHSCDANVSCPQLAAYNDNAVAMPFQPQQPGSPSVLPAYFSDSTTPVIRQYRPSMTWRESVDGSRLVRKRITRACDRCHRVRTKCNGQQPCTLCTNMEIECRYNREQKRRGKAPRKDLSKRVASKDTIDTSHCINAMKLTSATSSPCMKEEANPVAAIKVEAAQHIPETSFPPPLLPLTVSSTLVETTSSTTILSINNTPTSFYPQHFQHTNNIYISKYTPTFQE